MGTVTPVVVPGEGYVRVEVDWTSHPHTHKCWAYRIVGGVRTMLRDGNAIPLSGGIAVLFDHEMPYDVPIAYRSVIALNANGDFEDGVSEWLDTTNSGTIGAVTQSKAYYVPGEGVASAQLVPSGLTATVQAVSEFIPATAGVSYTVTGRVMLSDYWTGGVGVRLAFYNGVSLLSTVGAYNDVVPAPGEFGTYGFAATAPATTTQMRVMFGAQGTPPSTLRLYGDEVYVTTSGTQVTAADVVVPSDGAGWWLDPLHPATKIKLRMDLQIAGCVPSSAVGLLSLSAEVFPADEEDLPVNNATLSIGAWQVRKGGQQTLQVVTVTMTDLAQLKALYSSGAPLLLQFPAAYGEAPAYGLHGELEINRLTADLRRPWRVGRSSFVKVIPPVGPPEGTWRTRYMDFTLLSTFADALVFGGGLYDDFQRTVGAGGWGLPTRGPGAWAVVGTASDYQVNGSTGLMALGSLAVLRRARDLSLSVASFSAVVVNSFAVALTGVGAQSDLSMRMRYIDDNNYVDVIIFRTPTAATMAIRQRIGGVDTISAFPVVAGATGSSSITMKLEGVGTTLTGKAWVTGTPEPQAAMVSLAGITLLGAGAVELTGVLNASVTNSLPVTVGWDNLQVSNMTVGGAATWLDGLQGELMAP